MDSNDFKSSKQINSKGKTQMNSYFETNLNLDKALLVENTGARKSAVACIIIGDKAMIRMNMKIVHFEHD